LASLLSRREWGFCSGNKPTVFQGWAFKPRLFATLIVRSLKGAHPRFFRGGTLPCAGSHFRRRDPGALSSVSRLLDWGEKTAPRLKPNGVHPSGFRHPQSRTERAGGHPPPKDTVIGKKPQPGGRGRNITARPHCRVGKTEQGPHSGSGAKKQPRERCTAWGQLAAPPPELQGRCRHKKGAGGKAKNPARKRDGPGLLADWAFPRLPIAATVGNTSQRPCPGRLSFRGPKTRGIHPP